MVHILFLPDLILGLLISSQLSNIFLKNKLKDIFYAYILAPTIIYVIYNAIRDHIESTFNILFFHILIAYVCFFIFNYGYSKKVTRSLISVFLTLLLIITLLFINVLLFKYNGLNFFDKIDIEGNFAAMIISCILRHIPLVCIFLYLYTNKIYLHIREDN